MSQANKNVPKTKNQKRTAQNPQPPSLHSEKNPPPPQNPKNQKQHVASQSPKAQSSKFGLRMVFSCMAILLIFIFTK